MTVTQLQQHLIGYARVSTVGQTLDGSTTTCPAALGHRRTPEGEVYDLTLLLVVERRKMTRLR
jgi:hypothetical protein